MRRHHIWGAAFFGALILTAASLACASSTPPSNSAPEAEGQTSASVAGDDGLPDASEAYATRMKGAYHLTEDREGGRSCDVALSNERTIGGYVAQADNACIAVYALPWFCSLGDAGDAEKACAFKPTEDIFAWFLSPEGDVVLIDAARQPLFRLKPVEGGIFYQHRDSAEGLESLALSPVDTADDKP